MPRHNALPAAPLRRSTVLLKHWRFTSSAAVLCASLAGCASAPRPEPPAPTMAKVQPPGAIERPAEPPATPTPTPTITPSAPVDQERAGFARWIETFRQEALQAGISPPTVASALDGAQLLPQVIELDRSQPEFTRPPWAYLDTAVSAVRIQQGRAKLAEHRSALESAASRYGVPAEIITAIWGMESNYGAHFGSFRTVDSLATLAYEGRRSDWARSELMAALRIIDQGDIAADRMVGSWAGAMGHTQFLPSVFLAYAVDADGDGHRDIWGSIPDVIASTANFLSRMGWRTGRPWGVEVRLPSGFDYERAELAVRHPSTQWAADGVQSIDGQPLPELDAASILVPAGSRGPAFLVGPNFRAILRYNNSTNYALGVGLLARQIGGGPGVSAPWPRDLQPLTRAQTKDLQDALNTKGFAVGTADGVMGPATRMGLRRYQQSVGLVADGYPTLDLLQRVLAP
ncbi:lytic murein transglycosylase [Acidovorax sp. GBBC 3334]|uniref:lytic murein transglycosylase n=1 Tax=Acidovorax sp. GBBC 3334 TaxID=2940496 RepID=UPI002302B87D|nr:lytic murein transglycosylase [Acidovorax sp. GBBC 3334]MDA8453208.1 lytic murein transglycosylase [Acidovorax sp. GBBC 3334]